MQMKIISALVAGLCCASAYAVDAFTVRDIRVEGLQRTEAGTVFSYLPVKVGDQMTDEKATAAIKALFATGFFKDVRVESEGDVLVVTVVERPAIAQLDFSGIKEFDKDTLKKGLRDIGLAESRIFDRSMLDRAEQELKRQYLSRGHYAVEINTTVTPLERNRVAVNFTVDEGEKAKIKQINIVGATAFKEKDLLGLLALQTPGWLSWYTKSDQYSKQKLQGDLETLRSHYLDRGYLEFTVDSTQVSISPDKKDIYITINVTEGDIYKVSSVKLAGELLLPEDELRGLVKLKPGETFSRKKLTDSTKAISDKLGNEGYAFANVNSAPDIDKEKREVAFTILLDPGRKVYVRRINVEGNNRTRDEVIRREVRQMEASTYDGEKINRSRTRVDRLNYFEEVTVDTPAVPNSTDQVDMTVKVKEKPTGSLLFGAGFSSSEKLVLSGSVSQQNVFGSGKAVAVQINSGKINRTYSLSATDPYYTPDGVSRGFDIYHRNVDPTSLSVATYRSSSTGFGVRYGYPIAEDDSISFGLSIDRTRLETFTDSPQVYKDYVTRFGNSNTTLLAALGWAKDKRDSAIYPTNGSLQRFNTEVAVPGGTLHYYRMTYQHQRFFLLSPKFTLMLNGDLGIGNGYGGRPLPFFKNFYGGGIGSVRGFDSASLGPRVIDATGNVTNQSLGGNRRVVGNAELLFPMPGSGQDKSVRLGVFLDAGQVWASGEKMSFGDLRYSTGLSVSWTSPLGPLKFSVAQPIKKEPEDRVQRFQFQFGQIF
ncbi:MAG: outer membrane protein assembly factor BamA [Rhodocyclaceae bacterium]|nr:outer membrane protein assembly factor BamA [Rhodocyclaceae bacterium]MBX3669417.1 outer membrane protein assembly factor BamA [Rhodocyclaceae bacterium]